MATVRKIAVSTGGGDAPGLNAAIRAVTLAAIEQGIEVWGIGHGYRGLLEDGGALFRLDRERVRGITWMGGTILGTANRGDPFKYPTRVGEELRPVDRADELLSRFRELGFEALVALGGDGSMRIAKQLLDRGLPRVIGVPKTIDNDLHGSDATIGFDTAVGIAAEAIDRIHTTAEAHERVLVVEVMGRSTGWIALEAGIASTADAILIPEIPFDLDRVADKVRQREARGRRFSIVVVAEGAAPRGGGVVVKDSGDVFRGHVVLGGIAEQVARELSARTGKESRALVLGHLQRGGGPSTFDRLLALRLGTAAVRCFRERDESGLVALRGARVEVIPLEEAVGPPRTVPLDNDLLSTARDLGTCFGDEPEGWFLGRDP